MTVGIYQCGSDYGTQQSVLFKEKYSRMISYIRTEHNFLVQLIYSVIVTQRIDCYELYQCHEIQTIIDNEIKIQPTES